MFFLVSLVVARNHDLTITRSLFRGIINIYGLKDSTCTADTIITSQRIKNHTQASSYQLSCMLFKNTKNEDGTTSANGGALSLKSITSVILTDLTFQNVVSSEYGGAAYFESVDTVEIINNMFQNCEASNNGGSLYFNYSKQITIKGSMFNGSNSKQNGGSIYVEPAEIEQTDVEISTCTFKNSNCMESGGACYLETDSTLAFIGNRCSDCSATGSSTNNYGGCLHMDSISTAKLANNYFEFCSTDNCGGAVSLMNLKSIECINNTFDTTSAEDREDSFGGAMYLSNIVESANFSKNTFESCYSIDYGCGLYLSGSETLRLTFLGESYIRCYYSGSYCGSIYIYGIKSVEINGFCCSEGIAEEKGGGIDFEGSITKINILNAEFTYCESYDQGGSIYFPSSTATNLYNVSFLQCRAYKGGALYYETDSTIIMTLVLFDSCVSDINGSAIYTKSKSIYIITSNFTSCSATKSGGGVFIQLETTEITFQGNRFESCKSTIDGASIYVEGLNISYNSLNNVFIGSTGGSSGAVHINGYLHLGNGFPVFLKDQFVNCRTNSTGEGSAILLDIKFNTMSDLKLSECSFINCSSTNSLTLRIRVNHEDAIVGNIHILGCDFRNSNARNASSIYVSSGLNPKISLLVSDSSTTKSVFQSLTDQKQNNVIVADVLNVAISNSEFNQLKFTGAVKVSKTCENLTFNNCSFTDCKPFGSIINTDLLKEFSIWNSIFKDCESCINAESATVSLRSVAFDRISGTNTLTSIVGTKVEITDLNISNSNEKFGIHSNQMTLNDALFTNSNQILEIFRDYDGLDNPMATIDNLRTVNSPMVLVHQLDKLVLTNCDGSFGGTNSDSIFLSGAFVNEITNCNFTARDSKAIHLEGKASMSFCNVYGEGTEGPCITTTSVLNLTNSSFVSSNRPIFQINGPAGKVILVSDSNCINKPFNDTFTGDVNVVDENNVIIDRFNNLNNRCKDENAEQFILSSQIEMTNEIPLSYHFDELITKKKPETKSALIKESERISIMPKETQANGDAVDKKILPSLSQKPVRNDNKEPPTNQSQQPNKGSKIPKKQVTPSPSMSINPFSSSEGRIINIDKTIELVKNSELLDGQENANAEKASLVSTGLIAGVAAGIVVVIIISVTVICLVVRKKKKKSSDIDVESMDTDADLETSISSSSYIDGYSTSYMTQESTGTMWTAGQVENDFAMMIEDMQESDFN